VIFCLLPINKRRWHKRRGFNKSTSDPTEKDDATTQVPVSFAVGDADGVGTDGIGDPMRTLAFAPSPTSLSCTEDQGCQGHFGPGQEHESGLLLLAGGRLELDRTAELLGQRVLLGHVCASEKRRHAVEVILLPVVDQGMIVALGTTDIDTEEEHAGVDGQVVQAAGPSLQERQRRLLGCVALADDSGLQVDALSGEPGVHSARFAGDHASDTENNAKLLRLMEGLPKEKRTARFRCVVAVSTPEGTVRTAAGECEGRILEAPKGKGGFGYDPLFYLPDEGKTFAELGVGTKNQQSHRAQAMKKLKPELVRYFCLH